MKHLKAIFFDIDDTLYSTTEFAKEARKSAISAMIRVGLQGDEQELYQELGEVIEEFSPNFSFHFDKLLDRLPPTACGPINRAILIASAVMAYHETKVQGVKIYPDGQVLFEKLADQNLILGIITSGLAVKQAEKIVRLGILSYLHPRGIFISGQVGINKPNPKLYQKALSAFGLAPSEAMYVGDNPQKDILPSKNLGMWSVRICRGGKHSEEVSPAEPHYTIENYRELEEILKTDFGVAL